MTELEAHAKDYAMSRKLNLSEPTDITHVIELIEKAYIDGSKGQWHDLRKDPKDLPSCNDLVIFRTDMERYIGKIDRFKKLWWTGFCLDDSISNSFVIAWCEIPAFDKESE